MTLSNMTGLYVPRDSPLHRLDPKAKFFGFLILVAAVIMANTLAGYVIIITAMLVLVKLCGMPASTTFFFRA